MTRRQMERFSRLLETKKAELLWKIQRDRGRLSINGGGDPLDRVRKVAERDLTVRELDLETAMLGRVKEALREIEVGTFGRCASCDGEIPLKRLAAVPWSPYCVSCQEAVEADDSRRYLLAS